MAELSRGDKQLAKVELNTKLDLHKSSYDELQIARIYKRNHTKLDLALGYNSEDESEDDEVEGNLSTIRLFHDNGAKKYSRTYQKLPPDGTLPGGERVVEEKHFDVDGGCRLEIHFALGQPYLSRKHFYHNQRLQSEQLFFIENERTMSARKAGHWREYYDNGNIKKELQYDVNGVRSGVCKKYAVDGSIEWMKDYTKDYIERITDFNTKKGRVDISIGEAAKLLDFPKDHAPTSTAEVNRQYRKVCAPLHPDKSPDPDATERFIAVSRARDALLKHQFAPPPRQDAELKEKPSVAGGGIDAGCDQLAQASSTLDIHKSSYDELQLARIYRRTPTSLDLVAGYNSDDGSEEDEEEGYLFSQKLYHDNGNSKYYRTYQKLPPDGTLPGAERLVEEKHFDVGGVCCIDVHFALGQPYMSRKHFYPNQRLKSEQLFFVENERTMTARKAGHWRDYYDTGGLKKETQYDANGVRSGVCKKYALDGSLEWVTDYTKEYIERIGDFNAKKGKVDLSASEAATLLEFPEGIVPTSPREVNRQYRKVCAPLHPDKSPDPDATERFIEISRARDTLLKRIAGNV